jgi:hypothetical protein
LKGRWRYQSHHLRESAENRDRNLLVTREKIASHGTFWEESARAIRKSSRENGQRNDARLRACWRRFHGRGWSRGPYPGRPSRNLLPVFLMPMSVHPKEWPVCADIPIGGIVCHAVCPNSRLNARFEGVGCLHMPSWLEGRKLHVLGELVGSNISASDSGFPIHTQEVTGSSPVAPTNRINRLRPHIPEKASTTSTKVAGQLGGLIFLRRMDRKPDSCLTPPIPG